MTWDASPDAAEILAIRAALDAAGVPRPHGADSSTLAWVLVALAQVARLNAPPTVPVAVVRAVVIPEQRRQAIARIDSRAGRAGCYHPEKKAYDVADREELIIADRRRKLDSVLYPCPCGWSHLGATPASVQDTPPLPDEPALWARDRRQVCLVNCHGDVIAVGRVLLHEHDPTVQVETDDRRRITWRADRIRALDQ